MPELPEVETLRRSLAPVVGHRIQSLYLSRLAPVETTTRKFVKQATHGARIERLERWGKYLLFDFERQQTLVLHLGMSGRLFFYDSNVPARPVHTHLELQFAGGGLLRFIDARRFGTISLSNRRRIGNPFLQRLGPDYLDRNLSCQNYIDRCRRHPRLNLKMMLLNQSVAAGMGNIYACEALYRARLDPRRRVEELTDEELTDLLKAARTCLRLGIRHGGTSFRDYLDGRGHRGKMKEFLQVYDRAGQSTLDDCGRVERIVQQGRSTFFCPTLQR